MPYIDEASRPRLMDYLELRQVGAVPKTEGELNYAITQLCIAYIDEHGKVDYATMNAIVGVLECVKLEMYRRVIAPYENKKIAQNGDVYPGSIAI